MNSQVSDPEISVSSPGTATGVISSVQVSTNTRGASARPESAERASIKYRFRDAGLFADVIEPSREDIPREVRLNVSIKRDFDYHRGANSGRAAMVGLTFFLLAPVMDFRIDCQETVNVEAIRWDGAIKNYQAQADGTAVHNIGMDPGTEKNLAEEVHKNVLNLIINQMIVDQAFYFGE